MLREALADRPGVSEKRMFGGLAFLLNGNMLCGVHKGGGMLRVGPKAYAQALAVEGVQPMAITGRPMTGFVDLTPEVMGDSAILSMLLAMALDFVGPLPGK